MSRTLLTVHLLPSVVLTICSGRASYSSEDWFCWYFAYKTTLVLKKPGLYLLDWTFGFHLCLAHKSIYFPVADLKLPVVTKQLSWILSGSQFNSLGCSSCTEACFFFFTPFFYPNICWTCGRECTKPCDVLKVKQTRPVDTDLLEFPDSFHHILVQLREA